MVNRYVDWFIKLVRKHTQRIPNVKSLGRLLVGHCDENEGQRDVPGDHRGPHVRHYASHGHDATTADETPSHRHFKGAESYHKGKGKGYQQGWSPPGQGRRYRTSTWTTSSPTWRPWPQNPIQWQGQQQFTWPTTTSTTWQATPTQSFPPSTPTPSAPFNPAPPLAPRNPWNSKGDKGSKGAGKKGKPNKGV